MWNREPFFGGCNYISEIGLVVTGLYSPGTPLEYEGDCTFWKASNVPGELFASAQEAMDAADLAQG